MLEAVVAPATVKAAPAPAAEAEAEAEVAARARPPVTTRAGLRRLSSRHPSWWLSLLSLAPTSRSFWTQRAFHTAPASLTRTCAPRELRQPGQPKSSALWRRSLLFLTGSKLGCSTASIYHRRGGRRRGAPRYSRFFRLAVTRHGPWTRGSAAA
jgi:hypothetical protein